jgi:type IX secretion system PorP/SprF family membrane protein
MQYLICSLLFSAFFPLALSAQDPIFSQLTGQPMYLNPAYAGATRAYRVITNFRSQWFANATPGFQTGTASFDMFTNSGLGLGLMVVNDQQGTAGLSTQVASFMGSYEVAITNDVRLRFGLQAGVAQRSFNTGGLVFGNQLTPTGQIGGINDPLLSGLRQRPYEDFSAGMIFSTPLFSMGFAMHHFTQPTEYSFDLEEKLPMKFTLHAGREFLIRNLVHSVQLISAYRLQGPHNQLDLGGQLYFLTRTLQANKSDQFDQFFIGGLYRGLSFRGNGNPVNSDAVAFTGGYVISRDYSILTIGLSYDVVVSQLGLANTAGTGEITVSYAFKNRSGIKEEPVPLLKGKGRCEDYLRWPNRKYNHTMLVPKMEEARAAQRGRTEGKPNIQSGKRIENRGPNKRFLGIGQDSRPNKKANKSSKGRKNTGKNARDFTR